MTKFILTAALSVVTIFPCAALAQGTQGVGAVATSDIPASLVCRAAVRGETPTATASDNSPLVCKKIDPVLMMTEMRNIFMMPVGVDWQALLLTPSDQHER